MKVMYAYYLSQLNVLRCLILPIGYGIFLAVAQVFLNKPNHVCVASAGYRS
jgi:hypothetical protein